MPVRDRLQPLLDRALQNRILSEPEAKQIQAEVARQGGTPEATDAVVRALQQAVESDGLELNTGTRRRNLERLLSTLPAPGATGEPVAGGLSVFDALVLRSTGGAPLAGAGTEQTVLPKPGFKGQRAEVEAGGRLLLDGKEVALDAQRPSQEQVDALMALVIPGQIDALTAAEKQGLQQRLGELLESAWPVPTDKETTFLRMAMTGAAAGALARLGGDLEGATVDRLLAAYGEAPSPMAQTLLLQALDGASLSPAQQQARAGLEEPEHKDGLQKTWDDMAAGDARLGYTPAEGGVQQVALAGLAFARSPEAAENLYKGLKAFEKLNSGPPAFDAETVGHLEKWLGAYTNKHEATAYVYGTFEADAPKELASITNARVQAKLLPKLEGGSPRVGDVPLTTEQAGLLKELAAGLKDERALAELERSLKTAAQITSSAAGSSWGEPPTPDKPLSPAAFALFERTARPFIDARDATADGMLDAGGLQRAVKSTVDDIRKELRPRLAGLAESPPSWNGVEVAPETATLLRRLVTDHLRSSMSVTNLDLALTIVADRNGGKVTGQGAQVFEKVVADYMASWPNLQTFDFNKLERIATFAVEGKDVPLCTLNGQSVGLADFYRAVGAAVTDSIDRTLIRHEWMADRWGFRARDSVELLDVIAEKTAKGQGPVAELRRRFPGKEIEVHATGLDGVHQQFLFHVKDGSQTLGVFNEGSDGKLGAYADRKDPVLFTAGVNDDGSFDVKVPSKNAVRKYPLQTSYGVGDSIDVRFRDDQATELQVEGKPFESRSKVVEGRITGFTHDGSYQVMVRKPDGSEEQQRLSLADISKMNHPHYFSEDGSYLRDVTIDIKNDAPLREFLESADPIIQRFLPTDGSLAAASAGELAKRQLDCVDALMKYADENMKYPKDKSATGDADSARYHELDDLYRVDLGELVKIKRGVCRHQCIVQHLLLQRAGIDSRLASGAANTSSGNYRGLHLWVELSLADNSRYLSDQTWKDRAIGLWDGAYDSDKRRVEMYQRTTDFDARLPS